MKLRIFLFASIASALFVVSICAQGKKAPKFTSVYASLKMRPRFVSRYAPHASPRMVVTVMVSVENMTRISNSPKLPNKTTPIPTIALNATDAMSVYRKSRFRFISISGRL